MGKPWKYARKQDDSPVTAADIAAHTGDSRRVTHAHAEIFRCFQKKIRLHGEVRRHWQRYWPGRSARRGKEFIKAQWRIHGQYRAD